MSASRFRQRVDPVLLAGENARLEGQVAVSSLPRLARLVADEGRQGSVLAILEFWRDADNIVVVDGRLSGSLLLQCQRCLENFELELDQRFKLALLGDKQADALPDEYELLEPAPGEIVPAELIEDELLLAVPMVARHKDSSECGPLAKRISDRVEESAGAKPFAALAALKSLNPDVD